MKSFTLFKGLLIGFFLFFCSSIVLSQTAGQVMFVGYNGDGNDGFAFVTLVDLPNGATIYAHDSEWNGSPIGSGGAFAAGEGSITWSNNTGNTIAAGTVIILENTDQAGVTVNIGTASRAGSFNLGTGTDVAYLFLGSDANTPTVFLSAIANNGFSVANGQLTNTGLTAGTNAISITGNEDVMIFTGSINCTTTIADCATVIATATNWITQDTVDDDSILNGAPDYPTNVPCNFYGVAFGTITYYSRNATSGGNWDANTSWTTNSDGTGGPLAAGVWPRRHDHVVIRAGHTITINATNDNRSCGVSPDGLAQGNIGPFVSSNVAMFYQTGDITISGTLTVTGIEMMTSGYTHVLPGGTFSLGSNLVQVGYLEVDAGSTFSSLDDLILTGNSVTIINTNSTSTDDLIIDHTNATLCGTGTATLQNGAGSQVTYTNGGAVNQICTSFTVNCTGGGCTGFPVVGTTIVLSGNIGPAGVGNATNNKLWLKAANGTFSDLGTTPSVAAGTVRQWNDQSGNNNNAIQNTAGNRPIYRTNQDNGRPALEFTGDTFIDASSALGIPGSSSATYIIAFRDTQIGTGGSNDGSGHYIFDRVTATNELYSFKHLTGNLYYYQKRDNGGGGLGGPTSTTTIATGTSKWVEMVRNRGVNYRLYFNGAQESSIADGDGDTTPPQIRIGRHATTTNGGLRGFIYELIIYSATLNEAQRILINNNISAQYGYTLSTNNLYTMDDPGNGNYDFEMAGIGQASDGSRHVDAKGSAAVRMWNPSGLANGEFLMWAHDGQAFAGGNTSVDGVVIQERLQRIWRVSETGDVGTVSISVDLAGTMGSALGSNLRLLIDRDGDGFADNDVTPVAGSFSGTTVTFSGINFQNGDRFTIGNTNISAPLPIELLSFDADVVLNEVELNWTTATEQNNDFFTVQRSVNGEVWEAIGEKIKGGGNTTELRHYKTTDGMPHEGVSYYRLKQTDYDGQFSYSSIKRVELSSVYQLKAFPNPTDGKFTLTTGFEVERSNVKLMNLLGQEVPLTLERNGLEYTATPDSIVPGIYILQVRKGFWNQSIRIKIE
jgi:hypothetical protein